ncbi:MAG: hypothetical protein LBJ48_04065 [Coriobacteriales bacterium]|jgi:AAA+ ATPase superfamily predicted ATPase|nr:hypothetical protein [Coriobacteriales bacterium]
MQSTPFVFGRMAEGENFTDRKQERERLSQNFLSLTNTTIISPRRWGKSSLVKRALEDIVAKDRNIKTCSIDLFNVRNEAEFYEQLVAAIIKATSGKWEEWFAAAKEFVAHLRPQVSFGSDMREEISFDVQWDKAAKKPDELLDLAERVAREKDCQLIVCIDEFQSIGGFRDSLAFQRKLRSHWQNHQHVCYCLYGSKRHMMLEIFANPSLPFYRFGDIMLLGKISNADWGTFIAERFAKTDKSIAIRQAEYLADLVDNHPYYVQQLAQLTWLRTTVECNNMIIDAAMQGLTDQLGLLFFNNVESLTERQLRFLKAVLDGVEHLSSAETLSAYKLGTSANVVRIKKTLQEKEVIDITDGKVEILDPVFKHWLAREYFAQ